MPNFDSETLLLPVVEVGNLGRDYLNTIYYTKAGEEGLKLYPLLSLRKSLREMYSGDSEYVNRLFYLAGQLPEELVIKHADNIIAARDVSIYLSRKCCQESVNKML